MPGQPGAAPGQDPIVRGPDSRRRDALANSVLWVVYEHIIIVIRSYAVCVSLALSLSLSTVHIYIYIYICILYTHISLSLYIYMYTMLYVL